MIKRLAALLMAGIMLCLCSCGGEEVISKQKPRVEIKLSWWGNDVRNEYTLEAVRRFEELHPDIKVKCSYSEWSGYEARSRVQMVSGTEADVMQINVGWLSEYSPDGQGYYDISTLADTVDLSNFSERVLKYGRRNGVLNAIPIAMNAETVYINKRDYDRYGLDIPTEWEDFYAAAEVMKKDGVYPLSGAEKSIFLFLTAYAEQRCGKHIFNENSELTFDKEDFRLMIEEYCRMVNEQVIPKVEDYQRFNIDNQVYAGTVAWVSDAMNNYKSIIDSGVEIVAAPYPVLEGKESGEGWYEKPATLYAISKNTEHPKEAALLLDFMLNSAEWAELQGIEKGIPISRSARDHLGSIGKLSGLQYDASLLMEANPVIGEMDPTIESAELYSGFIDICDLVLYDKATLDEAAEQLIEQYKADFAFAN